MLPHGLKPWTSRLLAERSNQLSYESTRRRFEIPVSGLDSACIFKQSPAVCGNCEHASSNNELVGLARCRCFSKLCVAIAVRAMCRFVWWLSSCVGAINCVPPGCLV